VIDGGILQAFFAARGKGVEEKERPVGDCEDGIWFQSYRMAPQDCGSESKKGADLFLGYAGSALKFWNRKGIVTLPSRVATRSGSESDRKAKRALAWGSKRSA